MDIIIFIIGFIFGAVAIYIPFYIAGKKGTVVENQMKLEFENLANKILKESSQDITEQNKEKLEEFFKRFKDKIEYFEKINTENFEIEKKNFTVFDENIKQFLSTGKEISTQTTTLVNTMKSDNRKQGNWGEIVLEKVLESSGLRKDEEYSLQSGTAEGRPDATIFLPEGKQVFIDAKTSLASWSGYVNSEDKDEKEIHLKQFIDSTKSHITGLAKRDYETEETSPDYVLMFIPIESCYSLFFCEDNTLWNLAWKNNIMPVSPSTLLAALKIINSFYVVDRQNKNTKKITDICSSMIDKFSLLLSDMTKIQSDFNSAMKKLAGKGNIINQLNQIQELGVKGTKEIPKIQDEIEE